MRNWVRSYFTRKSFAVVCATLTSAFAALAVVGAYEPRYAFMFALVFSFLTMLCFFHAVFGFANFLTASQARAIDYVYLGIAAVGVFVLAFNYEGRRQDYVFSERTEALSAELSRAMGDTMNAMSIIDTKTCGVGTRLKPFPDICELVEKTDEYAVGEETKRGNKITVEEFIEQLPPPPAGQEESYGRVKQAIDVLKIVRERAIAAAQELNEHKQRAKSHDIRDESLGIYTWPFILAFAFALRLTRTTIEVFDWIVRPSPAGQTSSKRWYSVCALHTLRVIRRLRGYIRRRPSPSKDTFVEARDSAQTECELPQ